MVSLGSFLSKGPKNQTAGVPKAPAAVYVATFTSHRRARLCAGAIHRSPLP